MPATADSHAPQPIRLQARPDRAAAGEGRANGRLARAKPSPGYRYLSLSPGYRSLSLPPPPGYRRAKPWEGWLAGSGRRRRCDRSWTREELAEAELWKPSPRCGLLGLRCESAALDAALGSSGLVGMRLVSAATPPAVSPICCGPESWKCEHWAALRDKEH